MIKKKIFEVRINPNHYDLDSVHGMAVSMFMGKTRGMLGRESVYNEDGSVTLQLYDTYFVSYLSFKDKCLHLVSKIKTAVFIYVDFCFKTTLSRPFIAFINTDILLMGSTFVGTYERLKLSKLDAETL